MSPRPVTSSLVASVLIHLASLAFASRLVEMGRPSLHPALVPIQLVTVAPAPPDPPTPPQKEPAKPRVVQKITPPRIVERTELKLAEPTSNPFPVEKPPLPSPLQVPVEYPPEAKELLPGPPPSPTAKLEEPEPGPLLPLPAINADGRGNVLGPSAEAKAVPKPASSEGGEAGAGGLSTKGDVALLPGIGVQGGSGGPGRSGLGLGATDGGAKVAGIQPGAGREGPGGGAGRPIRLAGPQGGYQIKPRYPESARREGIEGITLLKFQVLIDGTVGRILIERSAGHQELDRTAVEAIKQWRFEPARRGSQPIAVWVALPVRFELR